MDITINTAQNVGITYKPAGLMPRIIATVIDLALLGGVFILGSAILLNLYPRASWFPYTLLVTLLSFYHLVCEYFFNGQSIGKATLRLRVVRPRERLPRGGRGGPRLRLPHPHRRRGRARQAPRRRPRRLRACLLPRRRPPRPGRPSPPSETRRPRRPHPPGRLVTPCPLTLTPPLRPPRVGRGRRPETPAPRGEAGGCAPTPARHRRAASASAAGKRSGWPGNRRSAGRG